MTVIVGETSGAVHLEAECADELYLEDGKGLSKQTRFQIFRVSANSRINIGQTYLSPMPGCCGIVISHFTVLNNDSRHTGMSDMFRKLKEKMAKDLGYSMMIATTQMENIPAVGNFFKSKYRFVSTFLNKRTGKLLGLGIKKL